MRKFEAWMVPQQAVTFKGKDAKIMELTKYPFYGDYWVKFIKIKMDDFKEKQLVRTVNALDVEPLKKEL